MKKPQKLMLLGIALAMLCTYTVVSQESKDENPWLKPEPGRKCCVCAKANKVIGVDVPDSIQRLRGPGMAWSFCSTACANAYDEKKHVQYHRMYNLVVENKLSRNCPLDGKLMSGKDELNVGGAKINFCSAECKDKVNKTKGTEKVNLVFGMSEKLWRERYVAPPALAD